MLVQAQAMSSPLLLEQELCAPSFARYVMCLLVVQAQAMSSPEELQRRWQVVLSYHGGSAKLWREHLQWQRAQYASFAVPQLRASYQNAVQVRT